VSARRPLLLAALALAAVAGATGATAPRSAASGGAASGEIVFASPRATVNPGEILSLAAGRAPVPVFDSPYAEVGLATAPVGRALAFWSNRSGSWRLMLSPDGVHLRSVAVEGAGPLDAPPWPPVFSADGTRLLVPYLALAAIAPVPALAVASVASGPAVDIDRLCGLPPVWAPDGRAFACATPDQSKVQVADPSGHVLFSAAGKLALWSARGRIAISGGELTSVLSESGHLSAATPGVARAWSRDGKLLALTRADGLVLADATDPRNGRILVRGALGASATWVGFTPDGRDVAFAGALGARSIAVKGSALRPLRAAPGGTWARDGRYAAAVASARAVHVELSGARGGARAVSGALTHDGESASILAWTGDGSRLLYDTSAAGTSELWRMGAGGAGQAQLTSAATPIAEPAWNAAGTKLAYRTSSGPDSSGIVVASARGVRLARLPGATPGDPSRDDSPSWSPDGRQIAVADATQGGVTAIEVASGKRTDVAVDGVAPAWSPGGSTIAFVDLDDGTVWGSAPNGAGRHRLLPAAVRGVRRLAWSPDGKRLVFATDNGIYVAAPTGTDPGRAVVAATQPSRPSFSPDGSEIVYSAETGTTHPYRAVFVVGIDGSDRRQLTQGPYDSGDPAWRPAAR
jgi:WD40 repeat protein